MSEAKDGMLSTKILKNFSRLLLLTSLGSRKDMKVKALRLLGFITSMTDKVKEKYKL